MIFPGIQRIRSSSAQSTVALVRKSRTAGSARRGTTSMFGGVWVLLYWAIASKRSRQLCGEAFASLTAMATGVEREAKLSRSKSVASLRIREQTEERERQDLVPHATKSADAKRVKVEEPSPTRTNFAVDRDRIVHSKAFRRTKHKTQVFLAPVGDHYRTRLTHILEVSQIGRSMARALRLNEDLVEAMALGHDIGHTPFGHVGEELLAKFLEDGFRHNRQSVRIAEKLEKNGAGLNLTHETLDGILKHSAPTEGGLEEAAWGEPETPEGWAVRYADKIAYLHHDIDDAMRAGIIAEDRKSTRLNS